MSLLSNFFNQNASPMAGPMNQSGNGILGNLANLSAMFQKYQQFAQNPVGALLSMNPKLNIPQNLMNNPEAAVKHLISSGQMSQEEFNQFSQAANQFQSMLPRF